MNCLDLDKRTLLENYDEERCLEWLDDGKWMMNERQTVDKFNLRIFQRVQGKGFWHEQNNMQAFCTTT